SSLSSSFRLSVSVTACPCFFSRRAAALPLRAAPMIRTSAISHHPQQQTDERKYEAHAPKQRDDLSFLHAAQLKVMMDRRHLEHTLSRPFEMCHLDHYRQHLDDEHTADDDQQQFLLRHHGDRSQQTA